jgi:prepilin-type N-terminal cleavage/methylation domain-containing protein
VLKKGFTLIELLVVIGIISILIAMETFVFLNSQKTARDGKRKADLENVRAAVEQYRSSNNSYPPSSTLVFNASCTTNSSLQDGTGNTYINPLPSDPRCSIYSYYYSALPSGCDGSTTVCTDYTLGTKLEQGTSTCSTSGTDCLNSGISVCNYCVGPYGTK